ncbi:hypothetical protein [Streptomyces syringium]|uniref:hypothetical protein n=1 Tax=Streptomyces syringium TaxID=76729 RepID=UPI0033CCA563
MSGLEEEELVGHSYTRARKHPLVIGKLPGAGRLPGGPYTITQIVTMVATFGLLIMTRELWARFGLMNFVVLIALPWGMAWVLRYARLDGRDPARALRSLLIYSSAPAGGRLSGRPQRTARPRLAGATCTIHVRTPDPELADEPTPAARPAARAAAAAPSPVAETSRPAPRTHLQALLASLDERPS